MALLGMFNVHRQVHVVRCVITLAVARGYTYTQGRYMYGGYSGVKKVLSWQKISVGSHSLCVHLCSKARPMHVTGQVTTWQ